MAVAWIGVMLKFLTTFIGVQTSDYMRWERKLAIYDSTFS